MSAVSEFRVPSVKTLLLTVNSNEALGLGIQINRYL
jgi:hypothetical protein